MAVNAVQQEKTVADPIAEYQSIVPLWKKNRAVCGGERFVKEYDAKLDVTNFSNLLVPFSPKMSEAQYKFFKAEAELPGIVTQYVAMIIGGLLRKKPQLKLPEDAPEGAKDWIISEFGQDGSALSTFLDQALKEELPTARCWVYIDYPFVPPKERENMTAEQFRELKPYPTMLKAESMVNWTVSKGKDGKEQLTRLIVRCYEDDFDGNEFHAKQREVVKVHEIVNGYYQVRTFTEVTPSSNPVVVNGVIQVNYNVIDRKFVQDPKIETNFLFQGERLTFIPAWPLNGTIDVVEPIITAVVDKEISLYNKLSRRNHLLYSASTYTPYIATDMVDTEFDEIVEGGLGTWIRLHQGDTMGVLETPTAALADMEIAIQSNIEEMAKLGIRMLTPETAQSGVALELRNAAQTAQIGTLNMKVSTTLSAIICFMINWRYNTQYTVTDIDFTMSADFNPAPLGADWLRLVTEWYQSKLLPRSAWLDIIKQNDILDPEYNDEEGTQEIMKDEVTEIKATKDAELANEFAVKGA